MNARKPLVTFIVVAGLSFCAVSDDTEVFRNVAESEVSAPNVLFVFDSSPSMLQEFDIVYTNFDPSQTYSGDCVAGAVYWSISNETPVSCSSTQYFKKENFHCQAALDAMATSGSIFDVIVRGWNPSASNGPEWAKLGSWVDQDTHIECELDNGVHGETADDGKPYPTKFSVSRSGGGMWTSNSGDGFNWGSYSGSTRRFWSANYVNWYHHHREIKRDRLTVLKQVMDELLVDLSASTTPMNIGMMQFSATKDGGRVIAAVKDVDDNLASLRTVVQDLQITCATPLSETMHEAYLYLSGKPLRHGGVSQIGCPDNGVPLENAPSVPASVEGGDATVTPEPKYLSPIELSCQKNYVVVLSDGEPTNDSGDDSRINDILESSGISDSSCNGSGGDFCFDELAHYMYEHGITVDRPVVADIDATVRTFTIGFGVDEQILADAASKGGGTYYTAYTAEQLKNAFNDALNIVLDINTTFTAPGVAVNSYNRRSHFDQLYFSVFKPSDSPRWSGNLKRFRFGRNSDEDLAILDVNGNNAVDPFTGFFKETATSWWTTPADAPDGGNPELGGAAEGLSVNRKVYTYLPSATTKDLTHSSNAFNATNISAAMLGMDGTEPYSAANVIDHALGRKWNGSAYVSLQHMADPLHSIPTLVAYSDDKNGDGTRGDYDLVVFIGTNEGKLHAIDGETGQERFAYVPSSLLTILPETYENAVGGDKLYGVDGPITAWVKDVDDDGIIESGDHVYLYFTLRRGGREVHALDVTNPDAPKFLWSIKGGSGSFAELGQTWSAPKHVRVNIGGTVKDVLVFGGGYDANQDAQASYSADSMGRAIYMVDAETGGLLWSAAHSSNLGAQLPSTVMTNAIPSEIAVTDFDSDGLADIMYVGDMGGQVWRFDIHNGNAAASLVTGGVIAQLGAAHLSNPATEILNNRRFYEKPDISVSVDPVTGKQWANIAIGSGYRASPRNNEIEDHFYVVRDPNPYSVINDYSGYGIELSDLVDITGNASASVSASDKGWYLRLVEVNSADPSGFSTVGEKVLSKATTVDGSVIFTTFTPIAPPDGGSSCAAAAGYNRAYVISIRDGRPVLNLDGEGTEASLSRDDRSQDLDSAGISPGVVVLFADDGSTEVFSGPEKISVPPISLSGKTYWHEEDQ